MWGKSSARPEQGELELPSSPTFSEVVSVKNRGENSENDGATYDDDLRNGSRADPGTKDLAETERRCLRRRKIHEWGSDNSTWYWGGPLMHEAFDSSANANKADRHWYARMSRVVIKYLDVTTMHGVNNLGKTRNGWLRVIYWIAAFATCGYIFWILVSPLWEDFKNASTSTTFLSHVENAYERPFPQLRICPSTSLLCSCRLWYDLARQYPVGNLNLNQNPGQGGWGREFSDQGSFASSLKCQNQKLRYFYECLINHEDDPRFVGQGLEEMSFNATARLIFPSSDGTYSTAHGRTNTIGAAHVEVLRNLGYFGKNLLGYQQLAKHCDRLANTNMARQGLRTSEMFELRENYLTPWAATGDLGIVETDQSEAILGNMLVYVDHGANRLVEEDANADVLGTALQDEYPAYMMVLSFLYPRLPDHLLSWMNSLLNGTHSPSDARAASQLRYMPGRCFPDPLVGDDGERFTYNALFEVVQMREADGGPRGRGAYLNRHEVIRHGGVQGGQLFQQCLLADVANGDVQTPGQCENHTSDFYSALEVVVNDETGTKCFILNGEEAIKADRAAKPSFIGLRGAMQLTVRTFASFQTREDFLRFNQLDAHVRLDLRSQRMANTPTEVVLNARAGHYIEYEEKRTEKAVDFGRFQSLPPQLTCQQRDEGVEHCISRCVRSEMAKGVCEGQANDDEEVGHSMGDVAASCPELSACGSFSDMLEYDSGNHGDTECRTIETQPSTNMMFQGESLASNPLASAGDTPKCPDNASIRQPQGECVCDEGFTGSLVYSARLHEYVGRCFLASLCSGPDLDGVMDLGMFFASSAQQADDTIVQPFVREITSVQGGYSLVTSIDMSAWNAGDPVFACENDGDDGDTAGVTSEAVIVSSIPNVFVSCADFNASLHPYVIGENAWARGWCDDTVFPGIRSLCGCSCGLRDYDEFVSFHSGPSRTGSVEEHRCGIDFDCSDVQPPPPNMAWRSYPIGPPLTSYGPASFDDGGECNVSSFFHLTTCADLARFGFCDELVSMQMVRKEDYSVNWPADHPMWVSSSVAQNLLPITYASYCPLSCSIQPFTIFSHASGMEATTGTPNPGDVNSVSGRFEFCPGDVSLSIPSSYASIRLPPSQLPAPCLPRSSRSRN